MTASLPRSENGEGGAHLFSLVVSDSRCGNDSKLHWVRFRLGIGKNFTSCKLHKTPCTCFLEVVEVPCLSMIKRHFDNSLNDTFYLLISS